MSKGHKPAMKVTLFLYLRNSGSRGLKSCKILNQGLIQAEDVRNIIQLLVLRSSHSNFAIENSF